MKTLYLLRHGKSDWDADFDRDRDRPIGSRGRRDARRVAKYLEDRAETPERILCSDALRTRQTLAEVMDTVSWSDEVVTYDERLYLAPVERLYEVVRELDREDSVLVVGHEPTLARTAGRIIGGSALKVPTACVLRIDLDIDVWKDLTDDCGRLVFHVRPKSLRE